MRKFLSVVFSGLFAVSFSQIAAAQGAGVQGSAGAEANVEVNKDSATTVPPNMQSNPQVGESKRDSEASGGASVDDKNPDSPGKGWAKGHTRGKGHGAYDERHGGRHSQEEKKY